MKIGIINGPNLNLLGSREPEIYGRDGFEAILAALQTRYPAHTFVYYQSNIEGELIDAVQDMALRQGCEGILLNAGGYTHTSVALHDAIKAVRVPVLEIHPRARNSAIPPSSGRPAAVASRASAKTATGSVWKP